MSNVHEIRDVNCAVIGGAGFFGSHLTDVLIEERDCRVLVLDNLCAGRREFIHKDAEFIHADITESESFLRRCFEKYKIRYVFNLAAHPYVPSGFERPIHVFNTNAVGALYVINAAQEAGCERILQISSAELYGQNPNYDGAIDEYAPVTPHSTYGAAKAAIDFLVQARWREARTPCIALRQFNMVGERDELHPYVVVEVVKQLAPQLHSRTAIATVRLGNNSTRDLIYVKDAARIAVELLERGKPGEFYNLGSEECIKIYDLAVLIGELMGFDSVKVEQDPAKVRPWEIWWLRSDNSKIRCVLDPETSAIRSLTPLREALRRTIEYFKSKDWRFQW